MQSAGWFLQSLNLFEQQNNQASHHHGALLQCCLLLTSIEACYHIFLQPTVADVQLSVHLCSRVSEQMVEDDRYQPWCAVCVNVRVIIPVRSITMIIVNREPICTSLSHCLQPLIAVIRIQSPPHQKPTTSPSSFMMLHVKPLAVNMNDQWLISHFRMKETAVPVICGNFLYIAPVQWKQWAD